MASLRDKNGREWQVSVDVNAVKRVRSLCGVNIADLNDIAKIDADDCLLVDVLYAILKPEADKASLTDEQFGEALGSGDALMRAAEALMEGISDFFRSPQQRNLLKAMMEKAKAARPMIEKAAMEKIEKMTPEAIVQSISSSSATNSPES